MTLARFVGLLGILLVVLAFAFSPTQAFAYACQSNATGNWSEASTWTGCNSTIPQAADTVQILDTHTVTLDTNATTTSITIDSGGTLTEDNGGRILAVSGGWTNNGTFTAGESTVKWTGTQTIAGETTFNNLTVDPNVSSARTITMTNATSTVLGVFTMDNSSTGLLTFSGGIIAAKGDVVWDAASAQTNSTAILLINGTTDQLLTVNNATRTSGDFIALNVNKISGDLTFANNHTIRTSRGWTFTGVGTGNLITTGSTVVFASPQTVTGSHTLNNVTIDYNSNLGGNTTISLADGTTLTIAGTFTFDNTGTKQMDIRPVLNGSATIAAQGDIYWDTADDFGADQISFLINGAGPQLVTASGGSSTSGAFASTTIAKSGGTLTLSGTLRTAKPWQVISGTVDGYTNNSTLSLAGTHSNFIAGTNATYGNIYIDTAGAVTLADNLSIAGNWTNTGSFISSSNTVTFTGSGTSTIITGGTGTTQDFQNFTVNKTGNGVAQLSTNGLDVDGTLTVSGGTLDLNGQSISTTATCNITGTLKLTGDETVSCTPTLNSGATVEYCATSGSRAIKAWDYSSASTTINGAGGTFTDSGTRTVGGNFTIAAGSFTATNGTMNVAGNWSNSDTFTHNSGTVVLNGTSQSISGNTAFNNLTKNVVNARTLTFEKGSTQTIAGALNLTGTDGNLLSLRSSEDDEDEAADDRWILDWQGTYTLGYLDVKDSNNTGGSVIPLTSNNITDSGNNVRWSDVDPAPAVSLTAPEDGTTVSGAAVSLAASASDDVAVTGVQFKVDTNTNIGSEDVEAPYALDWDSTAVIDGSHALIAVARDGDGNYATSSVVTVTVDNAVPVRSAGSPSGVQGYGTTQVTMTLTTDEVATCKYGTVAETAYDGILNTFAATNDTTHSQTISGLTNGGSYNYYVRCQDGAGNSSLDDYPISFSVSATPSATAVIQPLLTTGQAPLTILFSATSSSSTGGDIVEYTWDFDDPDSSYTATYGTRAGQSINGTADSGMMAGHRFDNPGTYTVALTVEDEIGTTDSDSVIITVNNSSSSDTFYVKNGGNDEDNGLSDETAWATMAKVQTAVSSGVVSAGDSVLFNRGDVFQGSITLGASFPGTAANPVIFGAYGSGDPPELQQANDTDSGIFFLDNPPVTSGIVLDNLYIHRTAWTTTPAIFSFNWRDATQYPNLIIRNSDIEGGYDSFNFRYGNSLVIEDSVIHGADHQGLKVNTSNVLIRNTRLYDNGTTVSFDHDVYFSNANDSLVEHSTFDTTVGSGIVVHGVNSNVVIRNNSSHDNEVGLGLHSGYDSAESFTSFIVENNRLYDNTNVGLYLDSWIGGIVSNNLIYNNGSNGQIKVDAGSDEDAIMTGTVIANNVLYSESAGNLLALTLPQPADIAFQNNIVVCTNTAGRCILADNATGVFTSDYNLFFASVNENPFYLNAGIRSLAFWQGAGYDAHSLFGNPELVNPTADVSLLSSSQAIDAGTDLLSISSDYIGTARPQGGEWDIGAYEYVEGEAPDETDPSVFLTAPEEAATVSGVSVTILATASDGVGVTGVEFKLDINTLIEDDTSSPYSITWDSTGVDDGAHTLIAVARDAAGNYATSTAINISVDNSLPADITPPTPARSSSGSTHRVLVAPTPTVPTVAQLQAQIVVLRAQLNSLLAARGLTPNLVATTTTTSPFTRDLYLYREGPDVKQLQVFLNTHGYPLIAQGPGAPGAETEMFGRLTLEALVRFQTANHITPAVGYFGPKTRALVNELLSR